ncbi:uncharacterized protein [Dermacentor andersoni]|uniref:uncharacterized protein n=1 Tax=Dermacentor andersoni TaxID=34620 RepID=UPI0024178197|nr:uncharacterized protein LOC129388050 [Dermacentor andersoni]
MSRRALLLPAGHGPAGPGFPPRGGDERDRQPPPPSLLHQELLECLREQLPRTRRGDAFAPEVVLEFVRSITELQGDDFKERGASPGGHPPAEAAQQHHEGKHILDASLEDLNCDPVPVLLPLVVSPRGASDTAVANSNGSWQLDQRRRSAENALRRFRLRSHPSSEGVHERAVIAEALKDIRRRLDPSPPRESSEETAGPSELEELMEGSSLATTSEDTSSSQENTGHEGGDSTSAETAEATEQLDVEAASEEQSADSAKDSCPDFSASANYDLLSSVVSCLDPVVDHVEPLYTMRNVYQNIAQAYDTVFGSAQVDGGVPLFLDENPKQPADSCSACYDFTNHEYLEHHDRLPGGAFERFISSSRQSDVDAQQQTMPRVPGRLYADDCHFQSPHVVPQFQQVPLNAELQAAVQQSDGASGSSMIPSVDEKSFINFLFSTMSNDEVEGRAGQLDLFHMNSSVGFLNENADTFNNHVTPAVIADYNNNVFGFHDSIPCYHELATIDETERQAEVSGEMQVASTMRQFSEPTENSTPATSTEMGRASDTLDSPRKYQPTFEEEVHMTATQVFQVELSNMAPEFLQSLQDKNDDVNAEKGHVFPLSSRICDVLSTEPERNYDLLKSSPERCSWAKARTPFSDANLTPAAEMIPVAEEALMFRRRNGRNFFSDGNVLGDAISGGQAKHQEQVLDRPQLTSWPLKPAFIRDKDWMRRFAPLRPMFVREQRQPKKPPPLKPVFLEPQHRQLDDWTDGDTAAARHSMDGSLGWTKNLRLPSNAPSCLTDDEVNTEDIVSGLREDTAILTPLLLESRIPMRQQLVTTESSSGDGSDSDPPGPFGTSSSDDNKDSCTATLLDASEDVEDSATTSTATVTSAPPPPQHGSLHKATLRVYENDDLGPDEPQAALLAPLPAAGVMAWPRVPCNAPSATDEFDGSVRLFDFASTASEETAEVGGFNEVYPGSTKKTVTVRAMMPTIDEEDQE